MPPSAKNPVSSKLLGMMLSTQQFSTHVPWGNHSPYRHRQSEDFHLLQLGAEGS
ncbi:hypothetical protein HispidOSU_026962, partial [Sigmodon hispidus]